LSSGSSRIAGDRPVPHIVTELPGPKARAHVEFDETWTSPSLPRAYPIVPVRGDGLVVEDIDGNLFLDFAAGIAVNSTGHSHPRVVAAVREQAENLLHYSASDFYLPIYSQMCSALAEVAPMSGPTRVFLTNSGAEGVEGALKLARYASGRPYVIAFQGAFHGRTYGAVSLTASKAKYHTGFGPLLPGILHAPYAFAQRHPQTGERSHDPEQTFDYLENVLFRHQVSPTEVASGKCHFRTRSEGHFGIRQCSGRAPASKPGGAPVRRSSTSDIVRAGRRACRSSALTAPLLSKRADGVVRRPRWSWARSIFGCSTRSRPVKAFPVVRFGSA